MTEIMMMLGMYQFSVSTAAYESLRRNVDYRWPVQERIGRRPARQFVGIGDETIELSGVILPHYSGGLGQLDRMRELAGQGVALTLADGRGRIWGKYCITAVSETRTVFWPDGEPRRMEFSLSLGRYGEER